MDVSKDFTQKTYFYPPKTSRSGTGSGSRKGGGAVKVLSCLFLADRLVIIDMVQTSELLFDGTSELNASGSRGICSCGHFYIGQTGRSFKERFYEHKTDNEESSTIAQPTSKMPAFLSCIPLPRVVSLIDWKKLSCT